ncbi:MAG: [protein-PII] uridylyltransferase [Deferrisomatales bacterium]
MSADLGLWKSRLAEARRELAAGTAGCARLVAAVDELVGGLGRRAGWGEAGRALVALGGYGRADLAPYSDVDLLFLVDGPPGGAVEEVLYPLWDLGLEVGHAVRTPRECAAVARADLTAATAILDGRLLLGDRGVLEQARRRAGIRPQGSREMRRWVRKLIDNVQARRARFGEVSHLLEPHVKEGRGGLRDLQACRWVLACLGRPVEPALRELAGGEEALERERFLRRVRNALHGVAGRKTDHLTFDFHREVAAVVLPGAPIESFFEELHRTGHGVAALWEEVWAEARRSSRPGRSAPRRGAPAASTEQWAGRLIRSARSGEPPPEDVRRFLAQGPAPDVQEALRAAVGGVLHTRVPLKPLLELLHSQHRLGALFPELERVIHQVHYDARHAFTTGVHCVETLGAFEELWLGGYEREEPHLTRIAGGIPDPAAVRLAALCHDLGKEGGIEGHAQRGAGIARRLAADLGLSRQTGEAAAGLVRAHHVFPELAFRQDLEDPGVWAQARAAGPADALVCLAFADLWATHPRSWGGVWTDWKRDLLLTLHGRAARLDPAESGAPRRVREAVRAAAAEQGAEGADALWEEVPPREARQLPADLLAGLLALRRRLAEGPAIWRICAGPGGGAEILGVVQPLPRVLSAAAGALAELGFDVLSFQMHTWADGTADLWFRVVHKGHRPPGNRIAERMTRAVTGEEPPRPEAGPGLLNPRDDAVPVQTRIRLLPGDTPFYSALEVRCRDRRGLVRDLARVCEARGLSVEYALVTTHGPMAQDVFHLKDVFGGRIDGEDKKRALLTDLWRAVRGPSPGPDGADPAQTRRRDP